MKKLIIPLLVYFPFFSTNAQIQLINSGTSSHIVQIERTGNNIYLKGTSDYFARCFGLCDSLFIINIPGSGYIGSHMNLIDSKNLYVLSYTHLPHHAMLFKSGNGGDSWSLSWDTTGVFMDYLIMFDTLEGLITSSANRSFRTIDGGNSWNQEPIPGITYGAADRFGDSIIWLGVNERVFFSSDRGKSWNIKNFIQPSARKFFFLNKDTVLVISAGHSGRYFSYTFNQGDFWQHEHISGTDIYGIYAISLNEVYIVGKKYIDSLGVILRSTDRGKSWQKYETEFKTYLLDIKFLNDSIALISGADGVLFKWNKNTALTTSVPDIANNRYTVHILPNPANHVQTLKITTRKPEVVSIQLLDFTGRLIQKIYEGNTTGGEAIIEVNLSSIAKGIYIYRVVIGGVNHYEKTVIY